MTVWFYNGLPHVTLRYVLIRDVAGKFPRKPSCPPTPPSARLRLLAYFLRRWQIETTFQQVRAHLGVETQRQWSAQAITRTTPALMGRHPPRSFPYSTGSPRLTHLDLVRPSPPTFADALALVHAHLSTHLLFRCPTITRIW